MSADILIIDDEEDIRELISGLLSDEGYSTRLAHDADSALEQISKRLPSMIFLDIWMQGSRLDGLELLKEITQIHSSLPVVMISGHGNIETAVTAVKNGAYDYIEKPFKIDRLLLVAERALENNSLKREVSDLKKRDDQAHEMLGISNSFTLFKQQLQKIAPTNARILISGAAGTGKELAARWVHKNSTRAKAPFVTINASAITPDKMELALFGREKDITHQQVTGTLEAAHGGTLYLDEISDMPLGTQSKILRVLTEQRFTRVGGTSAVEVDVRIISSSSRNLENMIKDGSFRSDLYHRISVVPVQVPSLINRMDDLPILAEHFIYQISQATGMAPKALSNELVLALQAEQWPGNVRQLRNTIERLLILASDSSEITLDMLKQETAGSSQISASGGSASLILSLPLREARESFERDYLKAQISRFSGNISKTAEFVGMERSALHRKLKSLGISN